MPKGITLESHSIIQFEYHTGERLALTEPH